MAKNTSKIDKTNLPAKIEKLVEDSFKELFITTAALEGDKMNSLIQSVDPKKHTKSSALINLVGKTSLRDEESELSRGISKYCENIDELVTQVAETNVCVQDKERFFKQNSDSWILGLRKFFKRILFKISRLPQRIANIFRKKKKKINYWKHRVSVRKLARRHFQNNLFQDLILLQDYYHIQINDAYLKIKQWEEGEDREATKKEIEQLKASIQSDITAYLDAEVKTIIQKHTELFNSEYDIVGTMEYPSRLLFSRRLSKVGDRVNKQWNARNQGWANTRFALFDEWRLDLALHQLKEKCEKEFKDFKNKKFAAVAKEIDAEIKIVSDNIHLIRAKLNDKKNLKALLKEVNKSVENHFEEEVMAVFVDKMSNMNANEIIIHLENSISEHATLLNEERVIVNTTTYEKPIEDDDLKKISPYEIISFETLRKLESDIEIIKQSLFQSLSSFSKDTTELGQIISFGCESAIISIEEEEHDSEEESPLSIALEGVGRAENRLEDNYNKLKETMSSSIQSLESAIGKFTDKLIELTDNESIYELRLRLIKAKAAKQADELREQLREKIKDKGTEALRKFKTFSIKIRKGINYISERFILTASKPEASREISDFLIESQHAIDSLPLIYRRLYRIEPLRDLQLFEGRNNETTTINTAFKNWTVGRFAATAIVSEKWSGLTSFINFLVVQGKYPYNITRNISHIETFDDAGLVEMFGVILENKKFKSLEDVVESLNSGDKRIIILEDLQNLFLREVDGFSVLQKLCKIISDTSKNVFWITSATIYSWGYLVKAMNIDEYFSYVVNLDSLTDKQIVNIIWKRNRISGFNIVFEPNEKHLKDKKFRKLAEEEKQTQLKDEYFKALNVFAKSNVSLALIFWLLSTRDIDETTITIKAFKDPDLNFISVLSMNKVYTLQALILHDGLTKGNLEKVLHSGSALSEVNLMALFEDGIVTKKGDVFIVNPIVYRSVISMLKSKNLIH